MDSTTHLIKNARVIKLADNINTDIIYPSRFLPITNPEEMAKHALQGINASFPTKIERNCVIVAGINFGCGSAREHAVTSLKYAGVAAIIAKSFSRIFFRNSINQGLPVITCPDAVDKISDGETITVDFAGGKILKTGEEFNFPPLPPFIMNIIKFGGLINYTKRINR